MQQWGVAVLTLKAVPITVISSDLETNFNSSATRTGIIVKFTMKIMNLTLG